MKSKELRVISYGEALIDLIQQGKRFDWYLGGAPVNVAVAATKLGASAGLVATVGNDFFGQYIIDQLKQHGVDSRGVSQSQEHKTSLAFIFLDELGQQKEFSFYREADLLIRTQQIDQVLNSEPQLLCFGSLSLTDEILELHLQNLIKKVRSNLGKIAFDINIRLSLWSNITHIRKKISEYISLAQIVKANQQEVHIMTGSSDPVIAAEKLWQEHLELLVITLGKDGCFYKSKNEQGYIPAVKINSNEGDAVGAGDAFMGALCAESAKSLEDGRDLIGTNTIKESLIRANAAGAIIASSKGAISSRLNIDELENIITI